MSKNHSTFSWILIGLLIISSTTSAYFGVDKLLQIQKEKTATAPSTDAILCINALKNKDYPHLSISVPSHWTDEVNESDEHFVSYTFKHNKDISIGVQICRSKNDSDIFPKTFTFDTVPTNALLYINYKKYCAVMLERTHMNIDTSRSLMIERSYILRIDSRIIRIVIALRDVNDLKSYTLLFNRIINSIKIHYTEHQKTKED